VWAWLFPELRHAGELTEIRAPLVENVSGTGVDTDGMAS
jgi:hypothetical protein